MRVASEGPVRITKLTIDAAWRRRAAGLRLVIRDAGCPGLALVVNPTGMTWRLDWKPRGVDPASGKRWPSQSVTIGTPASHSPDAARDRAGEMKGQAKAGADLAAERRRKQAEANEHRASRIGRLLEAYADALPRRPKLRGTGRMSPASASAEFAHVRAAITAIGAQDRPVAEISVQDVARLLTTRAGQPATARKHFGALSRFLDWCVDQGHLAVNPCVLLSKSRRPRPVPSRGNCPSLADLARLWHGAVELSDAKRDLVRFLIAVPCRLREATRLDWSHLDLGRRQWTMPGALTKNCEAHRIHLHPLVLELLRARYTSAQKPTAGLVFPSPRAGNPIETFTAIKRALSEATVGRREGDTAGASGLTGWTFHDFRRAFASACAEGGVHEAVADAVLSHRQAATRGGVLGVYQRASRWPEQVRAMQVWGEMLAAALASPPKRGAAADNVIMLPDAAIGSRV